MNFNDCIDCGGETKKRCIPFQYFNRVAFEAAGWMDFISFFGKVSNFIRENSDSRHHFVFGEVVSVTDPWPTVELLELPNGFHT